MIFISHKLLIGTAFLRYFGEQIEQIICERSGNCGNASLYSFNGMVVLMFLSLLKSHKQLAVMSIVANISVVIALIAVVVSCIFTIDARVTSDDS